MKKRKKIILIVSALIVVVALVVITLLVKSNGVTVETTASEQINEWSDLYSFENQQEYNEYEDKYLPPLVLE